MKPRERQQEASRPVVSGLVGHEGCDVIGVQHVEVDHLTFVREAATCRYLCVGAETKPHNNVLISNVFVRQLFTKSTKLVTNCLDACGKRVYASNYRKTYELIMNLYV